MNKAAFLDRDGVINQKAPTEEEYITRWEEMQILPGVVEAITLLNRAGFHVVVVSNQRCVAKGLLTVCELDSLHQRLRNELGALGAKIDEIYYCPHEEQPPCSCRKPEPGMLFTAASEHQIDLNSSWMIGDSEKDVKAGRRAGCRTARILRPRVTADGNADVIAPSLLDAVHQILEHEATVPDRQEGGAVKANLGNVS
ncbi:MAG TPA: HAD family hydrolase [Terriglobales bacterium]|jgi:D-glycero-D-manno-heptose 1,7-bisphosphate phosphatase|nr:HAD family hydrolase [Terriglobales bacterium]